MNNNNTLEYNFHNKGLDELLSNNNKSYLEFEQGKYYAIVGQTGSGKSTLIQNINALLKPTTGTVT
ncbi:energy-coupling factor transporter ATPase, partial [Staphylococcus aureus]